MNFRKISFWVLSCVFSISMAGCKSGKSNNQNEAITDSVWTKSKVIETIKKVTIGKRRIRNRHLPFGIRLLIIPEILQLMK